MRHARLAVVLLLPILARSIPFADDAVNVLLNGLNRSPIEQATLMALEGQPDDGRVLPALHAAFERAPTRGEKQWIASTLIRLGDQGREYSDFPIASTTGAIEDSAPAMFDYDAEGNDIRVQFSPAFELWCQANQKDPRALAALQVGSYPEDVLILARARDPRAKDLLRRGLHSPNPLAVALSVQGLARMEDDASIPIVAQIAGTLHKDGKALIAMNLPWYRSPAAQQPMARLVPDATMRTKFVRGAQAEMARDRQKALPRNARQ